jgi:hypothetical protein
LNHHPSFSRTTCPALGGAKWVPMTSLSSVSHNQEIARVVHEMRLQPTGMRGDRIGRRLLHQEFRREGRTALADPDDLHITDLPP